MGESTTIAHAILTIVAVVIASIFAVAVVSQLNSLINSLSVAVKSRSDFFRLNINIVYAYHNESHIVIFLKNTGDIPYSKLDSIDIFVKDYNGYVDYYTTSNNNIRIVEHRYPNNILESSEVVELIIPVNRKYTPPIEVRIVLVNGYTLAYVIT